LSFLTRSVYDQLYLSVSVCVVTQTLFFIIIRAAA